MIPTYFLSMWMTNTAVVTIMIPVVEVTIQQLSEHCQNQRVEESKRLVMLFITSSDNYYKTEIVSSVQQNTIFIFESTHIYI